MSITSYAVSPARCQADPHCGRAVCFRIRPRTGSGQPHGQATATCADHLGETVQALARSAGADGLDDGYLQVCAVAFTASLPPGEGEQAPVACLPFASIPCTQW
jgi:hypothetical protein